MTLNPGSHHRQKNREVTRNWITAPRLINAETKKARVRRLSVGLISFRASWGSEQLTRWQGQETPPQSQYYYYYFIIIFMFLCKDQFLLLLHFTELIHTINFQKRFHNISCFLTVRFVQAAYCALPNIVKCTWLVVEFVFVCVVVIVACVTFRLCYNQCAVQTLFC